MTKSIMLLELLNESGLKRIRAMEWISVNDALPEEGQTVICCRKIIVTGWHCRSYCPYEKKRKGWHCDWSGMARSTFKNYPVTHWMPLPSKPKE